MRIYRPEGNMNIKFKGFKINDLRRFMQDGTIIEAPATKCDSELNLHFELGIKISGVIPYDEMEYNRNGAKTKNVAVISRVTKTTCFKVINIEEAEDGQYNVTLSRRQAQKECYDNFISKLELGQVINCKITHVEEYGAFCDIGCGLVALLPVENFCIARVRDPKKMLSRYKNLKVIVKSIDEHGRIILSQKELLGTWQQEADKFKPGDTVAGTVRLVEDYGVFVELTPNLAGLAEPISDVHVGDTVSVFVKSVIPEKMKIKLLIVDHNNAESRLFMKLHYRIPKSGFVRHWVYSPEGAKKLIESRICDGEGEEVTSDATDVVEETAVASDAASTDVEEEVTSDTEAVGDTESTEAESVDTVETATEVEVEAPVEQEVVSKQAETPSSNETADENSDSDTDQTDA